MSDAALKNRCGPTPVSVLRDTQAVFRDYGVFFAASTGASAGFLGLLFVALTVANQLERESGTRARRDGLGASAFAMLFDAFFVSAVSLVGDIRIFAATTIVATLGGLYVTRALLPGSVRAGNMRRGALHWKRNIALPAGSITTYFVQLAGAIALLFSGENEVLMRLEFVAILGLYAGALLRAWEIIGI